MTHNVKQPPGAPSGLGSMSGAASAWWVLSTASMAASAYHGYRRNGSLGWALGWGALGAVFPIITPAVAVAQGFGRRKGG